MALNPVPFALRATTLTTLTTRPFFPLWCALHVSTTGKSTFHGSWALVAAQVVAHQTADL